MRAANSPVRLLAGAIAACLLSLAVLGVSAPPVGADGAAPTNFESVIDEIRPDPRGFEVRVVGGDAFLEIVAAPGTEVRIPGYDGEPYLWIDADGVVHRNARSASTYLNQTRDGTADRLPDEVDPTGEPDWREVGDGGRIAWHDHRIHWMLEERPAFDDGEVVLTWSVPLDVDGERVDVAGRLVHRGDTPPWAAVVAAIAAIGAWALSRRRTARTVVVIAATGTAAALSLAELWAQPGGADPTLVPLGLALAGLACGVAGGLVTSAPLRRALPLAAVALVGGWALGRVGVAWMPILPGPLPAWWNRSASALAFGAAVGAAAAMITHPELPGPSGSTPQRSNRRSSGSQS